MPREKATRYLLIVLFVLAVVAVALTAVLLLLGEQPGGVVPPDREAALAKLDIDEPLFPKAISEETRQLMVAMQPGWNLGNTLDSHKDGFRSAVAAEHEVLWENPETTAEMIAAIRDAGFNTLRIPVTWQAHMDADGTVSANWMARVKEIVGYAYDAGMYVIINAHHDTWYTPSVENEAKAKETMALLWGQVAAAFSEYDERLLFEGMNEPRLIGSDEEWGEGTPEARRIVNELNAVFVETVRSSGGNNATRYLILTTYCADSSAAVLGDFELPDGYENLIVSVHFYKPYLFTQHPKGAADWDADNEADTAEIDVALKNLTLFSSARGVPVLLGELAAIDKGNLASRMNWTAYVVDYAKEHDMAYIWWDPGENRTEGRGYSIFDRRTLSFHYPEIRDILVGD